MQLKSLQWRLVFIFVSITLSLMMFVGVILNKSVESSYYKRFKGEIESALRNVQFDSVGNSESLEKQLQDKFFYPVKGDYRSYSIINVSTNEIAASSDKKYSQNQTNFKNEIFQSPNLIKAMSGGSGRTVGDEGKLTRVGNSAFFDYAVKIGSDYVLYFRYDREEWQDTVSEFNTIILLSAVAAVAASVVIGYGLSKTITVPISRIAGRAQSLAEGNFDQAIEVRSSDEIGKLTGTFNYMASELKNKITEISSEKSKIETILNYMTDGVIAFNMKGEVIHANPEFKRIRETEDVAFGFSDFTREFGIDFELNSIIFLENVSIEDKVISYKNKFLRVYFAVFTDEEKKPEGLIVVLQDITEQQRLENMRREFVANVSHELRTPITSIKTYSETLMDGAIDDKETAIRFLGVINSEADRMTRLVKDLLQLSRIENSQIQWNFEEMDIVRLTRNCIDKLHLEARNKRQSMESHVIGDIPTIVADRDRIEQVVLNLLTNAIKYTPEEGKITVYIGKSQHEVYVKVVDTGEGIPKEDLPRVCERFYRVDKARSRELGGTGLGLAIAKEIVQGHGGTIAITSELGKGTEVTVKLPICNSILNGL